MKPVHQLHSRGPVAAGGDLEPGDCWRTCIACLLELDVTDVPNFTAYAGPMAWWEEGRRWLRDAQGLDVACVPSLDDVTWGDDPRGWFAIATIPSPRGPYQHCIVITRAGLVAHDPHPGPTAVAPGTSIDDLAVAEIEVLIPPYEPFPDDYLHPALVEATRGFGVEALPPWSPDRERIAALMDEHYLPSCDGCCHCGDMECDGVGCIAVIDVEDERDHEKLNRLHDLLREGHAWRAMRAMLDAGERPLTALMLAEEALAIANNQTRTANCDACEESFEAQGPCDFRCTPCRLSHGAYVARALLADLASEAIDAPGVDHG